MTINIDTLTSVRTYRGMYMCIYVYIYVFVYVYICMSLCIYPLSTRDGVHTSLHLYLLDSWESVPELPC